MRLAGIDCGCHCGCDCDRIDVTAAIDALSRFPARR
jgi:hypothetical protein